MRATTAYPAYVLAHRPHQPPPGAARPTPVLPGLGPVNVPVLVGLNLPRLPAGGTDTGPGELGTGYCHRGGLRWHRSGGQDAAFFCQDRGGVRGFWGVTGFLPA